MYIYVHLKNRIKNLKILGTVYENDHAKIRTRDFD